MIFWVPIYFSILVLISLLFSFFLIYFQITNLGYPQRPSQKGRNKWGRMCHKRAVTKHHRPGCFLKREICIFQFWSWSPRWRYQHDCVLWWELSFWFLTCRLALLLRGGRASGARWSLFIRALIPRHRGSPQTWASLEGLMSEYHHSWGLGFQHISLSGGRPQQDRKEGWGNGGRKRRKENLSFFSDAKHVDFYFFPPDLTIPSLSFFFIPFVNITQILKFR